MGIREQAAADFRSIAEDTVTGCACPVTVVSPAGQSAIVGGLSTDVSVTLDPETGLPVVGRRASVVVSRASMEAAGIGVPTQVSDESSRPWSVRFADVTGVVRSYKVIEVLPDRALGALVLILEFYA